jgi:hypothetical protein
MEATEMILRGHPVDMYAPLKEVMTDRIDEQLLLLTDLDDHERIARELISLDIQATPGCISHCAIAHYLMKRIPELIWVEINAVDGQVDAAVLIRGKTEMVHTTLPRFLQSFADAFDLHTYPDLEGADCNCEWFASATAC